MKATPCPEPAFSDRVNRNEGSPWIRRLEWIVAITLSVVGLFLLFVRMANAGSLWRDEAESAQSALMPFGAMFRNFQVTSFPILFPLSVRAYMTFFGASDLSLRCFGLAVGIVLLGIALLPLRKLTSDFPLLLLAMIGLNANFLVAGTSLRGYGLGSLLAVGALVAAIRFLGRPDFSGLAWLFLACLTSVQCLFFNGPLAAAILTATMAVLLVRGNARSIWPLLGIAGACALSCIPYLSRYLGGRRSTATPAPVAPGAWDKIWENFQNAWGGLSPEVSWVWFGVISLLWIAAVWRLVTIWNKQLTPERELLLFGVTLITLSIVAYYAFFQVLPRQPGQRHFLALTCLVAAAADVLWANLPRPYWLRLARIGVVLLAAIHLSFGIWPILVQAESNAGSVAQIVEANADPADLVIINPWPYGISFNWYYHGAARWMTVPALADHQVHRYDLMLKKMESENPLQDIKDEIVTTLKSGNRVWFIGALPELPAPGEAPLRLKPAPDPTFGWNGLVYRKAWSQEITGFLAQHTASIGDNLPIDQSISGRENMILYVLQGWKD